jgi:hypothetical protein
MAGLIQLPVLTKFVEESDTPNNELIKLFNLILLAIFAATIVGGVLIPTFQRLFTKAVLSFSIEKSVFKLILHSFTKSGVFVIRQNIKLPSKRNISRMNLKKLPVHIMVFNIATVALLTVGSFAAVFAGSIIPELDATCITLSSVITGIAGALQTIFIDPHLSVLTDEVIEGKYSEADFRGCVIGMVGSRIVGTIASLALFIPASGIIVTAAQLI